MNNSPQHRVCFVEASIGGVVGGSLTGILAFIDRMDRRRFVPHLLLYEEKPTLQGYLSEPVPTETISVPEPVKSLGTDPISRLRTWWHNRIWLNRQRRAALVREFARLRPEVVYLANGLVGNLDAVLAARHLGIPLVSHEKGFRRIGWPERYLSRSLFVSISMTKAMEAYYRELGVRARHMVTVYDAVDCAAYARGGGDAVRREFGIPSEAPVVGILGHVQPWKGQLPVAEAVAKVRAQHPDLHLLIVGGVHRDGVAYAEELRTRAAAPDLAGKVVLTGERSDVAACLDAMDVVIHYSMRPEPFGRVLIEAMAAGRPVIAPREGGPLESMVDGETGLLVPPCDPAALAEAIARLLGDEALRERLGRGTRARALRVFDIGRHVDEIQRLLADAIASRG